MIVPGKGNKINTRKKPDIKMNNKANINSSGLEEFAVSAFLIHPPCCAKSPWYQGSFIKYCKKIKNNISVI